MGARKTDGTRNHEAALRRHILATMGGRIRFISVRRFAEACMDAQADLDYDVFSQVESAHGRVRAFLRGEGARRDTKDVYERACVLLASENGPTPETLELVPEAVEQAPSAEFTAPSPLASFLQAKQQEAGWRDDVGGALNFLVESQTRTEATIIRIEAGLALLLEQLT